MIFDSNVMANFIDLSPMVSPTTKSPSMSNSTNEMMLTVTDQLGNQGSVTIDNIQKSLKRFPELRYHLAAIATFVSYTNQYPWVNKKVYGPGGINVKIDVEQDDGSVLSKIISDTVSGLTDISSDNSTIMAELEKLIDDETDDRKKREETENDVKILRSFCHKILKHNDIYSQLYKAALSLVTYSNAVVDFSEDFTKIFFYSLNDIYKRKKGDYKRETPYIEPNTSDDEIEWVNKKTGRVLTDNAYIVTDGDSLSDSPMGRVVHYLNVIDVLETSMSVERLAKANSFVVWKVGVDGLPGEVVQSWLDVYKERVMTRLKAGTNNGNVAQASMSKSVTASHIFVPNYQNSPTEVESVNLDYRPFMEDINYWWSKVFMALGIPPYYALTIAQSSTALSGDVTSFHESLLGNRVRRYQNLLEKTLDDWLKKFILLNFNEILSSKYSPSVFLPTYVSGGEESRSEYMRRINQFSSAFSTLSVSGLPINPEFATNLMFPNSDPDEVIDKHTKSLIDMNPENMSKNTDNANYVNNMLDAIGNGALSQPTEEEF